MKRHVRLVKNRLTTENNILFKHELLPGPITIHWHDFYELDIILSGTSRSFINGKEYLCQTGDVVFMTPSDFHDYADEDLEIFTIHFTEDSVDSELLHSLIQLNSRLIRLSEAGQESMLHLCSLFKCTDLKKPYLKMYYRRLLESIMILYMQSIAGSNRSLSKSEPDVIQEVIVYINAHFTENPLLKDIAAAFHINEIYLCSLFKEHMGEGYKNYLRRLKLEHARKLISYTNLSITEVALNSGYNTQSHFNREFRKMYQMTPLQMRNTTAAHSNQSHT